MKTIGNLFELAESQLIKEKKSGQIPCYTELDVIEYAIKIRKWLDDNPRKINQVMKLTRKELILNHRKAQKRYILNKKEK
jgi:hypothetical protein